MGNAFSSLALSAKGAPALSLYERSAPRTSQPRFSARFDARIRRFFRKMQYSRMVQALSALSDDQLDTLGITRSDIPERARQAVFEG